LLPGRRGARHSRPDFLYRHHRQRLPRATLVRSKGRRCCWRTGEPPTIDAGVNGVIDRFCGGLGLPVACLLGDAVHARRSGSRHAKGERRAGAAGGDALTAALHQVQERALRLGATIYYRSLRAAGVVAVKRRLRNAGLILCYHNVVADEDRAGDPGLHMRRERFESQMRWLSAHYDVLSLRELIDRLVAGGSLRATAASTRRRIARFPRSRTKSSSVRS